MKNEYEAVVVVVVVDGCGDLFLVTVMMENVLPLPAANLLYLPDLGLTLHG